MVEIEIFNTHQKLKLKNHLYNTYSVERIQFIMAQITKKESSVPTSTSNEPLIGVEEASLVFLDSKLQVLPTGQYVRHNVMRLNDIQNSVMVDSTRSLEFNEQSIRHSYCSNAKDSAEYQPNRYNYNNTKEHFKADIPSWECNCGISTRKKESLSGSGFDKNRVYLRSLLFGKILEKPEGYISEAIMPNALLVSKECSLCPADADFYTYERPDMRVNPVVQVTPVCDEHKVKSNAKINLTFDQLNDAVGITVIQTKGE